MASCCTGLALSFPGAPQALLQSFLTLEAFSCVMERFNKPQPALAQPYSSPKRSIFSTNDVLTPFTLPLPSNMIDDFNSFYKSLSKPKRGATHLLLGAKYRPYGIYKDARSILIIHNLAHQGVKPATTYQNLGLPPEWYGALEWVFPTWARTHALDKGEAVNILKGVVITVDRVMTVSQGYSWEITTVEVGYGLNELLSSRKSVLNGVTNSIDVGD